MLSRECRRDRGETTQDGKIELFEQEKKRLNSSKSRKSREKKREMKTVLIKFSQTFALSNFEIKRKKCVDFFFAVRNSHSQ